MTRLDQSRCSPRRAYTYTEGGRTCGRAATLTSPDIKKSHVLAQGELARCIDGCPVRLRAE